MSIRLKQLRGKFFPIHKSQLVDRLNDDRRPLYLFIFAILFYIFYQLVMQPSWVADGEMWAEMATNYYPNANASSYLQKLLSTDAGYIPAPQRLIALIGNQLNLPAASIPYFYTWASILLTGMLVGAFCLVQFRILVQNDFLRLLTSIAVLLVADFETRTFINFTYFSVFFIAIITSLALVDYSAEVPWWAWFIPLFMLSKPAVLATLPAMVLAAFVSRYRFRLVVLLSVTLCAGQLLQMFISYQSGVMPIRATDIDFLSKLLAIMKYFLGFIGAYLLGPTFKFQKIFLILTGLFALLLCAYTVFFRRSASNSMILVGILLVFFNVFINVFALTDSWNNDMARLEGISVYRHIIACFIGCVLIVCGLVGSRNNKINGTWRFQTIFRSAPFLFFVWFVGAGWFVLAAKIGKEPISPTLNSSQWQTMARYIDSGLSPLCVPINPWWKDANWMYSKNCILLKAPPAWEDGRFLADKNLAYHISLPTSMINKNLVAAAVLIKPLRQGGEHVEASISIELKGGGATHLSGSGRFNGNGGLLMLVGEKVTPINEIAAVTLMFSRPVEVGLAKHEPADVPGVAWMGN